MHAKRFAFVAAFCAILTAPTALACWTDGHAAGKTLGQLYCSALKNAYRTGNLDLSGAGEVALCGDGSQGLSCKQSMADAVDADRTCRRLYSQDWAGTALERQGYSARSLFDVYAQSCRDQDPRDY